MARDEHSEAGLGTRDAVRRAAALARLSLAPERELRLVGDLARILAAFESLAAVPVDGVEPLHQPLVGPGLERDTRARCPAADEALERDALLERAPDPRDGHFGVPRTVDP